MESRRGPQNQLLGLLCCIVGQVTAGGGMEGRYMEDRDLKCVESYDPIECGKPILGNK